MWYYCVFYQVFNKVILMRIVYSSFHDVIEQCKYYLVFTHDVKCIIILKFVQKTPICRYLQSKFCHFELKCILLFLFLFYFFGGGGFQLIFTIDPPSAIAFFLVIILNLYIWICIFSMATMPIWDICSAIFANPFKINSWIFETVLHFECLRIIY